MCTTTGQDDSFMTKPATAFVICADSSNNDESTLLTSPSDDTQMVDASAPLEAEVAATVLPDRLRKRLLGERKCRPTNEQLDQKLAKAEQRRQKQFDKRAASAREAEARCRRVAEAMEALHARRPESRAQVVQRYARLRHDLQVVLGRFNSEVERTNCALFNGPPLLAFGGGLGYSTPTTSAAPTSTSSAATSTTVSASSAAAEEATQAAGCPTVHRPGEAFVVSHACDAAAAAAAAAAVAASASVKAEMPARLRQRLAAYPRRRGRHELKLALEKKLADAQRRKERYEQRRAESIKETEERCRRISETMEEISLQHAPDTANGFGQQTDSQQQQQQNQQQQQSDHRRDLDSSGGGSGSRVFYRRVAKLQVDLDCLFTKFNREIVTVRGRPVDLLETLEWPPMSQQQQQQQQQQPDKQASVACQTDDQVCDSCGKNPHGTA